jgi:predicted HicB family RNase H-like nuclease
MAKTGRPATGKKGKAFALYLCPKLHRQASRLAFRQDKSLSAFVSDLLRRAVDER